MTSAVVFRAPTQLETANLAKIELSRILATKYSNPVGMIKACFLGFLEGYNALHPQEPINDKVKLRAWRRLSSAPVEALAGAYFQVFKDVVLTKFTNVEIWQMLGEYHLHGSLKDYALHERLNAEYSVSQSHFQVCESQISKTVAEIVADSMNDICPRTK